MFALFAVYIKGTLMAGDSQLNFVNLSGKLSSLNVQTCSNNVSFTNR